ncbi:MAG: hypothetical protein EOP07_17240 [Proteobacteria bacterium]|nr:MAG: hypothetical protein EOP07_17240 [Pseudomonadota bacterium]
MSTLSWQKFHELSLALAERLKPHLRSDHSKIGIEQRPVMEGLILMAAGLALGLDPVLDEKSNLNAKDPELFIPRNLGDFKSDFDYDMHPLIPHLQCDGLIPEALKASFTNRTFYFSTSGSTGEAKTVAKSASGLLAEIVQLKALYQLEENSGIVSLVRPFHIYGFLHSFLLPLFGNISVNYWPLQSVLASQENGFPPTVDLLVSVPAHWNLIKRIWAETYTTRVVSSGSVFGKERSEELAQYKGAFDHYHEILGSTETGGIGHRLLEEQSPVYTLFEGISFEEREGGSEIFSPFVYPERSVFSADRLEINDPSGRTFLHLGRADRIFKYSGLRHSLSEVEDLLKALSECSQVLACFDEVEGVAQGGVLSAWLEGDASGIDWKGLQSQYLERTSCPYPRRLHVLETFPRDAQGKVSIAALKAMTGGL